MERPCSVGRPRVTRRAGRRLPTLLIVLFALVGIGVLVIWAVSLRAGAFDDGLFVYQQQGSVPIFHLVAEVGMAFAALAGVVGWLAAARWATPVLTFAAGMLTYGAVNSLGWALHNDAALAVPMGIALISTARLMIVVVRSRSPRAATAVRAGTWLVRWRRAPTRNR